MDMTARHILTPEDVEQLEAMHEGASGYFYKMLDYLEERIREGVRRGEFTQEEAGADLDVALWYSYACNNIDEYEYYYRAARWMPASEEAARAAGCGMWYYRYSCALLYCGRLEEALDYARKGVETEPEYVWGWLQLGKLRSHFGDREGALEAVERGLALEPSDYEFTTLAREIREGRSLEEMEFHWIDPEADRRLQAGEDENADDKRRAIACILRDEENLAAVKDVLRPTEWEADAPYCTFTMPYGDGALLGRYFGNEASLSKVPVSWVVSLVNRLPALERRGLTFLSVEAGVGTEGMALSWFAIQPDRKLRLCFRAGDDHQLVSFEPDFTLSGEGQPALERPGAGGTFLAFVLLEKPEWDADQFKRDLRDGWGIPCITEEREGEDGGSTLLFDVDGMTAAVSLYPFPVPQGEAEQNAEHNYLWRSAAETAARHRGQLLVSVLGREKDPRAAGTLQVKLVCAACRQAGVLGVYANGTVYQPEFYTEAAQMAEDGELPLLNLVWFGLYRTDGGMAAYTDGLRSFGKDEIEVPESGAEPDALRSFLIDITLYVLEEDVTFQDGETIGFSEGQRLPITRSAGLWLDGMTLKIPYPEEPPAEQE